jgi:hypothetical protein
VSNRPTPNSRAAARIARYDRYYTARSARNYTPPVKTPKVKRTHADPMSFGVYWMLWFCVVVGAYVLMASH